LKKELEIVIAVIQDNKQIWLDEFKKEETLRTSELIEKELLEAKSTQLHPLIDFHSELGYSVGVTLDKDKALQIINKKVYTLDIGVPITELPSPNPILVKETKFSDISQRQKEGILKIAKDLIDGKEIEIKPRKELFDLILEKVLWYWYHSDLRWHLFMVCFIIATYYHRLFPVFPNLSLQGVRKSGKTTGGMLIREQSWNPTKLQAGLRSAPLFRTVEDSRPTYLADLTKVDHRDRDLIDLFEIIEPHGSVRRCVGDENEPRDFLVFCPKVLMVRQPVPFSDKCIECLTESAPKGSPYTERRSSITSDPVLKEVPELLLRSVVCSWRLVLDAYNSIKQDKKLFGRRFELWRPFLAVCKVYAPERYEELLTLAYEDTEETERGDITSEVENTLLGYFLTIDAKKQSMFVSLKKLTEETQGILGSQVVKSYHVVKSALKNLKVIKKRMDTTRGVKYQIDLVKARKIAEERDIIRSHPVCPICGHVILDGQETETDVDGEPVHKLCYSIHPLKPPKFCHLCGEEILEGQDLANWNGSRMVHRSCNDKELERTMDPKQKHSSGETTEVTEESHSRLPSFEEMQAEMEQTLEDED